MCSIISQLYIRLIIISSRSLKRRINCSRFLRNIVYQTKTTTENDNKFKHFAYSFNDWAVNEKNQSVVTKYEIEIPKYRQFKNMFNICPKTLRLHCHIPNHHIYIFKRSNDFMVNENFLFGRIVNSLSLL